MKPIKALSWIINNECNMRCVHCYPDSGIEIKEPFDKEKFCKALNSISSVKFETIFISGGEPILDKQFYDYIEIAQKITEEIHLCTNGTLLTDEVLKKLTEYKIKEITISLQSCNEEISQKIYQRINVFDNILNSIKRVKNYNFIIALEMTLMKPNYLFIDEIFDIANTYGIKYLSFKRLREIGRASSDNSVKLTPEQNYEALKRIFQKRLENKNIEVHVHDPLYSTVVFDYMQNLGISNKRIKTYLLQNFGYPCRAGTEWIGIDPKGNVSPCPLLLYKNVIIGNIFENTLLDILENSLLIRQLQEANDMAEENCKYHTLCSGCRVAAIAKTNNLFAKDPMCIYKDCSCPISLKNY